MNKSVLRKIANELNIELNGNVKKFIFLITAKYLKVHNIFNRESWLKDFIKINENDEIDTINKINKNDVNYEIDRINEINKNDKNYEKDETDKIVEIDKSDKTNEIDFNDNILDKYNLDNYNEEFESIECIGWLYQYFISEKKMRVFYNLKNNIKVEKTDIHYATRTFYS